jgi:hypothetical protein
LSTWQDLRRELDAWHDAGRVATFWWRDDDATAPSPALDRLLDLREKHGVPLALAVIPARAEPSLAQRLTAAARVSVVQHGCAHANHAPISAPKAEFGAHRPTALMLGELVRGWLVLKRLFADRARAVLVPPHNRIADALAAALPQAGYRGLSTAGPRTGFIPGLVQVNTHVDIMNWTSRAFAGDAASIDLILAHLTARRAATVDPDEPTGLLTHHLAHDAAAWTFIDAVLAALKAHPAVRLADPEALFAP